MLNRITKLIQSLFSFVPWLGGNYPPYPLLELSLDSIRLLFTTDAHPGATSNAYAGTGPSVTLTFEGQELEQTQVIVNQHLF